MSGYQDLGNKADLEKDLNELPERVADAQMAWDLAILQREKQEAILDAQIRLEGDFTATEIKARINANSERFEACLIELEKKRQYTFLYERLMAAKKLASLRTAF